MEDFRRFLGVLAVCVRSLERQKSLWLSGTNTQISVDCTGISVNTRPKQ